MGIKTAVHRAYQNAKVRNWDKIYVAVDIHDSIAESNYKSSMPDVYPEAVRAIKYLNSLPEMVLILFSSCYEKDFDKYIKHFESHGMKFDYFNENPCIPNTTTGDFSKKFYYSVIVDDKAGFLSTDWIDLVDAVVMYRKLLFPDPVAVAPVATVIPTELSEDEYGKYFNAYYFSTYDSVDSYDSQLFFNKEHAESRRQTAIRESEVRAENYLLREKTLERVYAEIEASVPGHMIDSAYEAKIDSLEAEYSFMLDYDIEPTIVGELKIKKIYI